MNIIKTECEMCHPRCGLNVHVENGRILKVEPMPEHPFNLPCAKARAIPELVYSPERLNNPLRKVGGEFREITWNEAFEFVAQRLVDIKDKYGAKSIVMHTGRAFVGSITSPIIRRWGDVLGTPNFTSGGSFCFLARTIGFILTAGDHICSHYDSSNRCAVLWGDNPTESNPELANRIRAVQAGGSKLIVVDPRVIPLARGADIHAQLRPGTDCALALSMLNVIITEGLIDKDFVEQWTVGFDELAKHVEAYPPEKIEEVTWVSSETIRDMAQTYAINKPASISLGISMDHSTNGIQAMDLLGRKLGLKNGQAVMDLFGEIQQTIVAAKQINGLDNITASVEAAVNKLGEVALHLGATAMSPQVLNAFVFAHPFMDAAGDVIMAWMLLWRSLVAAPKLEKLAGSLDPEARKAKAEKDKQAAFYEGQLKTAEFFANAVLPVTMGKFKAIAATNGAAVEIPEASFGG